MQSFRETAQKNVKLRARTIHTLLQWLSGKMKYLSKRAATTTSNDFMQKLTRHYDQVEKPSTRKDFAENILFQYKKCCNPTIGFQDRILYGNTNEFHFT